MNSCLYECTVMHRRTAPKRHAFKYSVFMFYLDLDELDTIDNDLRLISRNRFAPYEYRDCDHFHLPRTSTRKSIESYLNEQGISDRVGKVRLLTNLRTWGHVFNPVSFYFVSNEKGQALCTVAEVGNTFREQKMYLLPSDSDGTSRSDAIKQFYVSPFSDLDTRFHFRTTIPNQRMRIAIDQSKNGHTYFHSTLTGHRRPLTDSALAYYALRFPLVTIGILGAIHWQALRLYLKRAPFHRKAENPHLQTDTHTYLSDRQQHEY